MQNKGKAWTDMSTGERKAVLIGWLAVLAIGAYFFWPSRSIEPLANGPQNQNPALLPAAVTFTKASPETMAIANQYFADVEQAMELGLNSLKSKSLKSMGDHSRRFSALADQGKALFGATIADHFGQCGIAGNFARAWWQAQVGAALKGGIESTPGEVQSNLSMYESRRVDCLNTIAEGLRGNS